MVGLFGLVELFGLVGLVRLVRLVGLGCLVHWPALMPDSITEA